MFFCNSNFFNIFFFKMNTYRIKKIDKKKFFNINTLFYLTWLGILKLQSEFRLEDITKTNTC